METKWYNRKRFNATVNGEDFSFFAHTTNTRNGFCHTVSTITPDGWLRDTKVSYINRTWERFDYETALKAAIKKCKKQVQQSLYEQIIEGPANAEKKRCDAFLGAFTEQYKKLSEKNKKILSNSPQIQSEQQAQGVLAVMKMMNALDALK